MTEKLSFRKLSISYYKLEYNLSLKLQGVAFFISSIYIKLFKGILDKFYETESTNHFHLGYNYLKNKLKLSFEWKVIGQHL